MLLQSKSTLDYTVYSKIKEMIIAKQLKPGEAIVQNQLSQTLGVSRTPLRKALGELEKEGLLESSPVGWFVKEFTMKDMVSVFEIRAVLEGLACRLAAGKLEAPDLAYLRAMFQQAYKSFQNKMADAYYKADVKFHNTIVEAAGDPVLARTLNGARIIATSQVQGLYRDPEETFGEHMAIIDALEAQNGDLAETLMRSHIQQAIPLLQSGTYTIYK
ncbi:MAG: GntR family transcriptional regulator [Paenibacillaceae bacterium]|uniref:GntR family transcriptional regulator n=1 Tax=Paenibacillus cymbidii TaxID=1639034 RepID=UPI00108107C6|nr:GntR family transcriptional regulator [Paenibacillus cymbidii]MBO9605029.1 GntR family transcriptional regulator [Paenibacillaceae bacterium]